MASILTHPARTEQPQALSDVKVACVMGLALANATQRLAESLELAMTAGTRFDAARETCVIVVGKAAELDPNMSVTQLLNVLTHGRR